jgi:hypothetical protein
MLRTTSPAGAGVVEAKDASADSKGSEAVGPAGRLRLRLETNRTAGIGVPLPAPR